jgi:hypothetical protein
MRTLYPAPGARCRRLRWQRGLKPEQLQVGIGGSLDREVGGAPAQIAEARRRLQSGGDRFGKRGLVSRGPRASTPNQRPTTMLSSRGPLMPERPEGETAGARQRLVQAARSSGAALGCRRIASMIRARVQYSARLAPTGAQTPAPMSASPIPVKL